MGLAETYRLSSLSDLNISDFKPLQFDDKPDHAVSFIILIICDIKTKLQVFDLRVRARRWGGDTKRPTKDRSKNFAFIDGY